MNLVKVQIASTLNHYEKMQKVAASIIVIKERPALAHIFRRDCLCRCNWLMKPLAISPVESPT